MVDINKLRSLSKQSPTRAELKKTGHVPVLKSMDLFSVGYTVVFWIVPGKAASELLEYVPRNTYQVSSLLPRIVVTNWKEQAEVHRALKIAVVAPGQNWDRKRDHSPSLFDALHEKEEEDE